MIVPCTPTQATLNCARMVEKGWRYCWFSKSGTSPDFPQTLRDALGETVLYDAFYFSTKLYLSLYYCPGDARTVLLAGCDPTSPDAATAFGRTFQWAKEVGLHAENDPSGRQYDEATRQLLAGAGLRTDAQSAIGSVAPADVVVVIYDAVPLELDAFQRTVLEILGASVGHNTTVSWHVRSDATQLQSLLPFAVARGVAVARTLSRHLRASETKTQDFTVGSPAGRPIHGHAVLMYCG